MSSKDSFPHISRPYKLQPRKPKAASTSPAAHVASRRAEKHGQRKTKPSAGRRILDFFKKTVPCRSNTAHFEEDPIDDYSDVIDISPRFNERALNASMTQSPDVVPEARTTCRKQVSSPSRSRSSTVNTISRSDQSPRVAGSHCNINGGSTTQSPRSISSSVDPFAANGESFYQAPELNGAPSTANIHDLSIYGSPASVNKSKSRVEYKAFYRAPLNIYNSSHEVVDIRPSPAKVVPTPTIVDSKPVKGGPSPVYVNVKGMTTDIEAPAPVEPSTRLRRQLSCNFPARPISTKTKYIFSDRDGLKHVTFKKRKRFVTYKHIQTLHALKEEDECVEDDSSTSDSDSISTSTSAFDSDSVPSPVNGDSPTPPVSVEDLECEQVEEDQPITVDNDVPSPRRNAAHRIAVYGRDQLHARSLSLPIISTAMRPSPVNLRSTGLRPLLLPIHVARREAALEGHI